MLKTEALTMIRSLAEPMIDLTNGNEVESDADLTLSDPVSNTKVQEIEENMALMTYLSTPTTPEVEFVKSVLNGCASKTSYSIRETLQAY